MDELIFKLLDDIQGIEVTDSDYMYNGIVVPRVTNIISKCIHNDSLMNWANSLGFKHKSYQKTLDYSAKIGTECHHNIDEFLNDHTYKSPSNIMKEASNAYASYIKWFNDISQLSNEFSTIFHEHPIACKWFGGTIDALYKINGKLYLTDYKTSNHITVRHVLQTSAYRYMLREVLNIEIDGIIILQLSKSSISYTEHMLNFSNSDHLKYINECEQTFLSMVYAYYNIKLVEDGYSKLQWGG